MTGYDSVRGISKAAGVSADSTKSVLSAALPSLLSGAMAQAQNSDTAAGFANALSQHAASDTSSISSFLGGVDLGDSAKIISHLLGGQTGSVGQIAQQAGVSEADASNILSAAGPLLMSLLGQQTSGAQNSGAGIGDVMGSLLGGVDLGGLLGGLLGGSSSGGLGSLLGGLFGKK